MARDTSTWHRLTDVDVAARTATCSKCGPGVPIGTSGRTPHGVQRWGCRSAKNASVRGSYHRNPEKFRRLVRFAKRPHLRHRGDVCELCGFVPEAECQLTVHHKDGVHDNNDRANLVTLCANCHWLQNAGMLDDKLAAAGIL